MAGIAGKWDSSFRDVGKYDGIFALLNTIILECIHYTNFIYFTSFLSYLVPDTAFNTVIKLPTIVINCVYVS